MVAVDLTVVAMPTRYGQAHAPSHRVACDRCGQSVWLSNRAAIDVVAAESTRVICVVCAMAVVEPGDLIQRAPWVDADVAAARELGMDPSAEL